MDLIKLIRGNEDFKGALRNVKNGPKRAKKIIRVIFKEVVVLKHFFHGYVRDSSCSGLLTCQGNLWNHSESIRTSKDASAIYKMAIDGQKDDIQRKTEVLVHFS